MADTQKRANFSALNSPSNGFSRHASPLANNKPGSAKKLVIKNFKGLWTWKLNQINYALLVTYSVISMFFFVRRTTNVIIKPLLNAWVSLCWWIMYSELKAALVCYEKQCFLQKHHLFEIRSASYLQFFTVSVTVSCALTCVLVGKCARLQGSLQFQREKSGQTSAFNMKWLKHQELWYVVPVSGYRLADPYLQTTDCSLSQARAKDLQLWPLWLHRAICHCPDTWPAKCVPTRVSFQVYKGQN